MKTKHWYILILILFTGIFYSCEEKEVMGEAPRLFRPSPKDAVVRNNTITVRWNENVEAVGYSIDVAVGLDSTNIIQTVTTDTIEYLFEDLQEETQYHFYIKALSPTETLNSRTIHVTAISGLMPSYFRHSTYEDIGTDQVTVHWKDPDGDLIIDMVEAVDLANPSSKVKHTLTANELTNKSATITGLTQGVSYQFNLLNKTSVKSKTIITTATIPAGTITVDATQNLKEIIESAPENATVMLKGGQLYAYPNDDINLLRSITIIGEPGKPTAKLYVKSFRIGGGSASDITLGEVAIKGIEASGYKLDGSNNEIITTNSEPGYRFISFDPASNTVLVTLDKLTIENCIIRNYCYTTIQVRTPKLRLNELNVDKCIVSDIGRNRGGYQGFIHLSSSNSNDVSCRRFNITNSTFVNFVYGFIEMRKFTGTGSDENIHKVESVTIENCTFDKYGVKPEGDNIFWGTNNPSPRRFIRFDGYSNVPVTIKNCVFGQFSTGLNSLETGIATGASLTFSSSVKSTDCTLDFTATGSGTDADGLFENRASFNYKIKDSFMYTNIGDPRWK